METNQQVVYRVFYINAFKYWHDACADFSIGPWLTRKEAEVYASTFNTETKIVKRMEVII